MRIEIFLTKIYTFILIQAVFFHPPNFKQNSKFIQIYPLKCINFYTLVQPLASLFIRRINPVYHLFIRWNNTGFLYNVPYKSLNAREGEGMESFIQVGGEKSRAEQRDFKASQQDI